jgi:ABC-type branched-subunit amino acid transport system substrate-binding protein
MTPTLRSGDLQDVCIADVLDACCHEGQTASVRVSLVRATGIDVTGAVFFEAGEVMDARFDGWEGVEALRRILGLRDGRFQVEVGLRSARRTIHEPWHTLSAHSVPAAAAKTAPALLHAVERVATPPPLPATGSAPRLVPPAAAVASERPTTAPHATPPAPRPTPAPRASPLPTGAAAAARKSDSAAFPMNAPLTSGPRPVQATGPRTAPFTGPHASPATASRSAPPTAPFSSVRRDKHRNHALRIAMLVLLAVAAGGGLAVGARQLLNRPRAPEPAPVAAPAPTTAAPAIVGVSDTEVTLGMAAPLAGASKELGRQMKTGVDVAFAQANADGGVNGRKVKLVALDDGYEPTRTREVMRELAEQRGVFGFVGNVGTPTAAVAVPYALERKMLFFGPFTGASLLRKEPPDRYVFNYRASYVEETAAIVRYLVEVRRIKPEQIAVFAQDDSYGEAGFQGVAKGLRQYRRASGSILRVTYKRNTADVVDAVERILEKRGVAAVVMVATYRPAARFIERVREQRPGMIFTNVSFVGSQALAEELVQLGPRYAQGVIVSQVVPLPTGQSTVGMRYRDALARFAPGEKPDFVSLEGYVSGNLLLEGLRRAGRNLTTEELVNALESIRGLDVGLGVPISFGLSEHQGSHKVWGTVLDAAGNFQPLELD